MFTRFLKDLGIGILLSPIMLVGPLQISILLTGAEGDLALVGAGLMGLLASMVILITYAVYTWKGFLRENKEVLGRSPKLFFGMFFLLYTCMPIGMLITGYFISGIISIFFMS